MRRLTVRLVSVYTTKLPRNRECSSIGIAVDAASQLVQQLLPLR